MGLWSEPKSLQKTSAVVVTKRLFKKVVTGTKSSEKRLKSKLICEEEHIGNIKKLLSGTQRWWTSIPGFSGKLGDSLKAALDDVTELPPTEVWDATDDIISLLLKLLLLDTVFIDRDYSNNCGLCSIPFASENITCSILKHYNFQMKKLVVYGAMYPSIVETIIVNSTNLKFLAISQVNLTDELMDCIRKCSKLEVLHFMHNYIWMAVSTKALCRGFFNQASEDSVSSSFHSENKISISFPNLKVLDIGPCMSKFVIKFYKWLLYYYEINSVCLDWKTCILEEDRKYSTENLILPLIHKGKTFCLESLYLNVNFLSSFTPQKIKLITEFMPKVNQLCLDCNFRSSYLGKAERTGEKFKYLAEKFGTISKLYVNISSQQTQTFSVVEPFLKEFGTTLSTLTITSEYQCQKIKFLTLKEILLHCPNIKQLKLLFLTRYSVSYDSDENATLFLPETKLIELWLHEVSPWDTEQSLSYETHTQNWIMFLNSLLQLSPHLEILSVTVCETMSELLLKLFSKATCFHLHVKDGCEWDVNENFLINLMKRLPNLKNLYLEELNGDIFWKIKSHFYESDLNIFWGNLGGWPRT